MTMKALILSAALALVSLSAAFAGWPHYRLVPNGHGGFNYYGKQGYRGWFDEHGYFDNQGSGYRRWTEDGEIPEY
jgi:hypothetical protein